jgi:hypothetical protein
MATAKNVFATQAGYAPVPSLEPFDTTLLPSRAVGLFAARSADGGWVAFAGTQTKLYRLVGVNWTEYTRAVGGDYSVPADEYWSFTQYGSLVIAVNLNDDAQVIDIDSGATVFSALGGSPPKARYVWTVGEFVVLGALASNTRKIRHSAHGSATGWTVGTDLCDEQEFVDGGRVTGGAGGEFGWVVQEKAVRRMVFQPGQDVAFRFERIEQERGASAAYSLAATANAIYYLSDDGFYALSAQNGYVLDPIGFDKINEWFRDNSDGGRFFSVTSFVDPFRPVICWAFYSSDASTNFDRLLAFNWKLREWTYIQQDAQYWVQFAAPGTTLEQLDAYGTVDSGIPFVFDSRVWEGGRPVVAAIDTTGGLSFLEGSTPLTSLLLTCPLHLRKNHQRSKVTEVYPLGVFNDGQQSIRVGKQSNTGAAQTFTTTVQPSTLSGIAYPIASATIHQFEHTITQSSGTVWQLAQGLEIQAAAEGRR